MGVNDFFAIASDNTITMSGLTRSDGTSLQNATITGTLRDKRERVVTQGLVLSADGANFVGVLPHDVTMEEGEKYHLDLFIVDDPNGIPNDADENHVTVRVTRAARYLLL